VLISQELFELVATLGGWKYRTQIELKLCECMEGYVNLLRN